MRRWTHLDRRHWRLCLSLIVLWLPGTARAQGQATSPPGSAVAESRDDEEPEISTGSSGKQGGNYIDSAVPQNIFRFRFDGASGINVPNRAEFLYAQYSNPNQETYVFQNGQFHETNVATRVTNNALLAKQFPQIFQFAYNGRGQPEVETGINSQQFSLYGEWALTKRFSVFAELPINAIEPQVNNNAAGLGDMNFGFKYALIYDERRVVSFQFRTYVPTGDSYEGLGTGHVSLEPGLLFQQQVTDRAALFGEVRGWIPVGGSSEAGNIIRYGIGGSWVAYETPRWWVAPVVEAVGWTVLSGQETVAITEDVFDVRDARGDTIVNGKVGLRFGFGSRSQFAISYSHALTRDVWYTNLVRVEYKLAF